MWDANSSLDKIYRKTIIIVNAVGISILIRKCLKLELLMHFFLSVNKDYQFSVNSFPF